jgi:GNAT superfamily N-acetyltransferase
MEIHMNGSPPTPEWPMGLKGKQPIQIRTLVPGEEIKVLDAVIDSFKDHWGYVDKPYEEEKERWLHWIETDKSHDPTLWFLAMDGDEIAGMSLCLRHAAGQPDMGWVETLGVRRPWRRRGLGLALLQHTFRENYLRGLHKVALGVDAQSLTGATWLYEKAGMHVARQSNTYEKELRPGEELSTQVVA